jgi:hypothetical protein
MAIGKAAKWISFATTQHEPTSSSVTQDTLHSAVSIADEKQFGLENVRRIHLHPFRLFDISITSLETLGASLPSAFLVHLNLKTSAQLRQFRTSSTVLLFPFPRPRNPIYRHLRSISTCSRITADSPTAVSSYPCYAASQIRARQARDRCPPSPYFIHPPHPLSSSDSLLRSPLSLRAHFPKFGR